MGAAAVAISAVFGYALPRTTAKTSSLGGARDHVLERAEAATDEAAGLVGPFAERSLETATGLLGDADKRGATRLGRSFISSSVRMGPRAFARACVLSAEETMHAQRRADDSLEGPRRALELRRPPQVGLRRPPRRAPL